MAEDFLKEYPEGDLANQAHARLNELYEQSDWRDAEAKDTISAYEDFIGKYPLGKFGNDAHARLENLYLEKVKNSKSIEKFLNYYQQGVFIHDAWPASEKLHFEQAQSENTISAYDGFLKQRNETMALGYVYAPLLVDQFGSKSSGSTANKQQSARDVPLKKIKTENRSVDVKRITFKIAEDGKELLFIEFNRFYTPAISGIEGKEPRTILDIANVSSFRKDWAVINTGGNLIRRIRSSMNSKTHVARIVLDMEPS